MDDSCSFTLNVSAGNNHSEKSQSKVQSNNQEAGLGKKPLISFVSKPRLSKGSDGEVRKPTFRVLRKKVSLASKKSLSDVKILNPSTPSILKKPTQIAQSVVKASSPADDTSTAGQNANLVPVNPTRVVRKAPLKKKSKWAVSEKGTKSSSNSASNAGVISSLFCKNPEIPVMSKDTIEATKENVFSSKGFSALNIHKHLIVTLEKDLQLTQMTEAQSRTIPLLLDKKDALVKSQTGSGKTLAYAIPIVEKLQSISPKIDRSSGVFALVIVPTRELVLQTYSWFVKILKPFNWVVPGYLIGGEKKKSEKARIRKGMNILISTPGRLLDHLSSTQNLNLGRLHWLVMDEADRLLDMGYEKDVARIMTTVEEHFNREGGIGRRQNVMLSATLSQGVEKLAGLALNDPVHVNMSEDVSVNQDQLVTPTNLKQWYLIVPPKLRLVTLASFILWKCTITKEKKVLIFLTTQDSVDYHAELFNRVLANREEGATKVSFYKLHGNMAQKDRTDIFKEFRDTESGVLLCTDVAARGLDLASVDWIVQYNPPVTAEEYVHRVGRTARIGRCGQALIFLSPSETDFVHRLAKRGISVVEKNPDAVLRTLSKTYAKASQSVEQAATALQLAFEETVIDSFNLYEMATKGYVSYIRSYAAFPKDVRDVFNFQNLHLGHYAKSFALRDPPTRINSAGRLGKRNDRTEQFRTARQRNPKRPAAALRGNAEQPERPLMNYHERKAMMSEFSSGLEGPPPAKRINNYRRAKN